VSLPGYFGVQSEAFIDFTARPAAAQLRPPSEAAAVSWLHAITPAEDAAMDALGGSRCSTLGAQQLHACASAETAELGRERATSYPQEREYCLTLCAPCALHLLSLRGAARAAASALTLAPFVRLSGPRSRPSHSLSCAACAAS
jgi:hypothetical protein